jgi:hypothetical protein
VCDEWLIIKKCGRGSSHGGAQAGLPPNIGLSRRLVRKNVGLATLRSAKVLNSFPEQRLENFFETSVCKNGFADRTPKIANNSGFYGADCDVRLQRAAGTGRGKGERLGVEGAK